MKRIYFFLAKLRGNKNYFPVHQTEVSCNGSVVIATGYGLDGPEVECRWRRDFPHLSRPALGPTQQQES